MNLYIYKYNNYYNRIVKYENTLEDYGEPIHSLYNCKDFSPNDGVNTTHIFGSALNNYGGSGDYLIVTDQENNLLSRWFIIEIAFTRTGQWEITLHRDLIVDYYNDIIDAPCFIEKATLPYSSNLLFNNENMTYNEVLTATHELKDETQCPWLVGYYAKNIDSLTGTINTSNSAQDGYIQIPSNIESWTYYQYSSGTPFIGTINTGNYTIKALQKSTNYEYKIKTNIFSYATEAEKTTSRSSALSVDLSTIIESTYFTNYVAFGYRRTYNNKEELRSLIKGYYNYHTATEENDLLRFNNKIVRDASGKYYNVKLNTTSKSTNVKFESGSMFNALTSVVNNILKDDYETKWINGTPNVHSFEGDFTATEYNVVITEVANFGDTTTYNIPSSRNTTKNVPYEIFAIPYGTISVKEGVNTIVTTDAQLGLETAMSMQVQHPGEIYDIQLLPYCPIPELITANKTITVQNANQYSFIKEGNTNVGIIFNVSSANFTNDIPFVINRGQSSIETKVNNETKKYRLSAPNYSNYFDFSAEKNGGVSYFNVDVSLKPFTPYIHINPNFGRLYGYDNNSPRGLVCGGDYSLSQVIDNWTQYQVQNKNYQLTFDRQIQNMDVNNNIARELEKWQLGAGVAQGAAAGLFAGSMVPGGAGIGALAGGAASLIGGLQDIKYNEQLRNETMDYTKDMFGYQLGNIRALPQTISKVSSFNINNKIFPVLEIYEATAEEVEALVNKMAYNGMTVMTIGTISQYLGNSWTYNGITNKGYIKGKLIRLDKVEDEYHLSKEIAKEINMGVYI